VNVVARLPLTLRIGLALILAGIAWFGGWTCWLATRMWVPLHVPISLSQGHIRTPEFTINVESTYLIQIRVAQEFDNEGGPCLAVGFRCSSTLRTSWSLSNRERVIASGNDDPSGRGLGTFHAGKGRYILDLDVMQDGSRLNAGAPHLIVFEAGGQGASAVSRATPFYVLLLFAALGSCLIIRSAIVQRQEKMDALVRASPLTQPGPSSLGPPTGAGATPLGIAGVGRFPGTPANAAVRTDSGTVDWNRHRKPGPSNGPAFSRMSFFGLLAAISSILMAISVGVLRTMDRPIPRGLWIHLLKPGGFAQSNPQLEPLHIRVESAGSNRRPRLFVNSQLVSWGDFSAVLRKGLSRRPPACPVYFEGDPDMPWELAVNVIDIIRGLQAEVVLLTARTSPYRKESGSTTTPSFADTLQPGRR
jgi:hypothetical protein